MRSHFQKRKCANLKKILELRKYLFHGSKIELYNTIFRLENFFRISLTISHLRNFITSCIFRVSL
jgi:hypothetical protein